LSTPARATTFSPSSLSGFIAGFCHAELNPVAVAHPAAAMTTPNNTALWDFKGHLLTRLKHARSSSGSALTRHKSQQFLDHDGHEHSG
jgi:hypothetical protein